MARYVLIGAIARPHGVKGDVQVVPFNPASPHWKLGNALAVLPRHQAAPQMDTVEVDQPERLLIRRVSTGAKGRLVIWFDGISDRTKAEALKGSWLALSTDALGQLDEGEFWYHEVAGWRVSTRDNTLLGEVVRIVDGATELLEVRPAHGGATYFIPMVDAFIVEIDREHGRVVVDPIEGLIP